MPPTQPTPDLHAVRKDPRFRELVQKRRALSARLTLIMFAIYFGFVLVVAFAPSVFAIRLGSGVMTLGIPVGLAVISAAFVLTGVYVARANAEFDQLTRAIHKVRP
ncbi:MAG: DUF485 domain-containing protein [Pseudomonadota bacterium]